MANNCRIANKADIFVLTRSTRARLADVPRLGTMRHLLFLVLVFILTDTMSGKVYSFRKIESCVRASNLHRRDASTLSVDVKGRSAG